MNNENEDASTVDLGYRKNGWTTIGNEDSFLDSIKVNGTPIKEVFPGVVLCALETGCGLALQNVAMKVGDILSIDEGAQFTHGGFSMTMYQRFAFRYDGATYEIRDAFLDEVTDRSYKIVSVATYDENCNAEKLVFKVLNHTSETYSNVNLGYKRSGWTEIETPFIEHIKVNGTPIKEVYSNVIFWALETGHGLALEGLNLTAGDVITIDKGAVFANGDITAKMMQQFTFTFNGTGYDVTATEDTVNEYSIVKVRLYGDGNTTENQMAIKFMNNENEDASTVDLGYSKTNWTELGTKLSFIEGIKINGMPIKQVCQNVELWALETGSGLALKGLELQDGDVVTIEKGTEFSHNGVSMQMQFEFQFAFESGEFDVYRVNASKTDQPSQDGDLPENDDNSNLSNDNTSDNDTQSSGEITTKGCRSSVNEIGVIMCCFAVFVAVVWHGKYKNEQKRSR
jgi:hypothetical protein